MRRILTFLLCIVLCLSLLPMASVSVSAAAVDNAILSAVRDALGVPAVVIPTGASVMNLDFTDQFDANMEGLYDVSEGVTYNANGLNFPSGTSNYSWRYRPNAGWSPLAATGNYGLRFRLESGGELQNVAHSNVDSSGRVFMRFREDEVAIWEADGTGFVRTELLTDFTCGNDWVDILVAENTGSGYDVFIKKASENKFAKIASTSSYRPGSSNTTGFAFSAQGAVVSYGASFQESTPVYNTVADVVGSDVVTEYHFSFDESFDDTIYDGTNGFTASGVSYDDETGLYLPSGAKWTFLPYTGWSPLKNTSISSSGVKSVMTFRAKLGTGVTTPLSLRCYSPLGNSGRVFLDLKTTESKFTLHTTTTNHNLAPGTEWTDYLLMQNDQGGVSLYIKNETTTLGKWELSRETSDYRTGGGNTMGLQLIGGDAYVKEIKVYNCTKAIEDGKTKLSGADMCYFQEDFSQAIAYSNAYGTGTEGSGGVLNLSTQTSSSAEYHVVNTEIPIGGYAEFRIQNNADANCNIYSGSNHLYLSFGKLFGGVRGVTSETAFLGDGGNIWREWRILRETENTYDVYTRAEGETLWYIAAQNMEGSSSENEPEMVFMLNDHKNEEKFGTAMLDDIRIFGSMPEDVITLTDGYGTKLIEEGKAFEYTDSLGIIVSGEKGTLLVSAYDQERGLTQVEIIEVDGRTVPEFYLYDGTKNKETVCVKVFLWDLDTMNILTNHRIVYTDPSQVEGEIGLLFNNEKYLLEDGASPIRLNGEEYLPVTLASELAQWTVSVSGESATLTGEDTLVLTVGETNATINGETVELYQKPFKKNGEIYASVKDMTDILPIGEDVTPNLDGVALHSEYCDEDTTFFNLINTLTGDPKNTRGFSWEAVPDYRHMVIEYEKGNTLSNPVRKEASYQTEAVVYNHHVTNPELPVSYYDNMLFYQVNLEGLEPGTTYSYRIGDTEKDVWSETYTFITETENTEKFSVVAIADTQGINANEFSYTKRTLDAAFTDCPNPAFVLNLGDITENGMCDDWWNLYFKATEGFCKTIPSVAVVGNHETRASGLKYYNLHYQNPRNGLGLAEGYDPSLVNKYDLEVLKELDNTVYSFDYGDVHFSVLNTGSDWMETTHVIDLQTEWLKEDMKASEKKWKIVLLHIPIYPATTNGNVIPSHLYEVMDECDVDMVLSGHDHITMRTKPLKGNVPYTQGSSELVSHANGTIYSILGCAGIGRQKFETLPSEDLVDAVQETAWNNPTYNIFTFGNDSITVLSKALDGTILDCYTLTK